MPEPELIVERKPEEVNAAQKQEKNPNTHEFRYEDGEYKVNKID